MTEVTCVLVSYNGASVLPRALASLQRSTVPVEIIVVDNASTDGSPDAAQAAGVHVMRLPANRGYGAAANVGLREAKTRYVIVANQDISVHEAAVEELLRCHAGEQARGHRPLIGARLETSEHELTEAAHRLPRLWQTLLSLLLSERVARMRNRGATDRCSQRSWLSAAFVLGTADAWAAVSGFDERYFLYVEDVDLFSRAAARGLCARWCGEARVTHLGGSNAGPWDPLVYTQVIENWMMYWRDRRGAVAAEVVRWCAVMGFAFRSVVLARSPDARTRRFALMYRATAKALATGGLGRSPRGAASPAERRSRRSS